MDSKLWDELEDWLRVRLGADTAMDYLALAAESDSGVRWNRWRQPSSNGRELFLLAVSGAELARAAALLLELDLKDRSFAWSSSLTDLLNTAWVMERTLMAGHWTDGAMDGFILATPDSEMIVRLHGAFDFSGRK